MQMMEPAAEWRLGKCVVQGLFSTTSILPVKIREKISSQSDMLAVICSTGSQKKTHKTKRKERA